MDPAQPNPPTGGQVPTDNPQPVGPPSSDIPTPPTPPEPPPPQPEPSAGPQPPSDIPQPQPSDVPTDVPEPTSPPPFQPEESIILPVIPPPSPKRTRAKIVGTILVFLILLIGIPVGVFLVQQVQEIREKAVEGTPCETEGEQTFTCTGQCGGCPADAGEAQVFTCIDGTWQPTGSECQPECVGPCVDQPPGCTNPDGNEGDRIRGDPYCIEGQSCPSDPSVGIGRVLVCQDSQWVETTPECTPECPAPGAITWSQCSVTDGPEPNLPCGSCSVTSVGAGTMTFSCELDCGGSASNCPGGSAGTYSIAHRWERCKNQGTGACTSSSSDYVESGDLAGPGPWTIDGQSTVNGSGTFPNPGCGRVQVDVQMSAEGTSVASDVYNTGRDCVEPTPTPTPPPPPGDGEPSPPTAQCLNIKAYDANWTQLSTTQLQQLKAGDSVRFAVAGTTSSGSFDQARFRINDGAWQQTTTKNSAGEFFIVFTLPSGVTTFKVEAEVHHADLNQWF